jgi:hypothetical protein
VFKLLKQINLPRSGQQFLIEQCHSGDLNFQKLPKFALVVSELFGNDPFQEGLLPTLRHVFESCPGAVGIPESVEVFFEFARLVKTPFEQRVRDLQSTSSQSTSSHPAPFRNSTRDGKSVAESLQLAMLQQGLLNEVSFPASLRTDQIAERSSPIRIANVPLAPPPPLGHAVLPSSFPIQVPQLPAPQGVWAGLVWFRANLLKGLSLSNHPLEKDHAEHWSPVVIPLMNKAQSTALAPQLGKPSNPKSHKIHPQDSFLKVRLSDNETRLEMSISAPLVHMQRGMLE